MARKCELCQANKAVLKRPKTLQAICRECFYLVFETEIHHTIVQSNLFKPGMRVAIGASGGKDSTVLAYVLKTLNERYNYGVELFLLSIDEGIRGYRDDSLETVKRNQEQYQLPLKIISYKELYGWSMDDIVEAVGRKNNCTFCGVFRRQALDRGALMLDVDHIVTGHNADDIAETILMNIMRGDIARLQRCTEIVTAGDGCCKRSKPFKYTYEKEIVMYAYFKKLDYFSTECTYSPNAYRGFARTFLKDLEAIRPSSILDIIRSGEAMQVKSEIELPKQSSCERCGYMSSNRLCKACVLLEGLNRGVPKLGIGKTKKSDWDKLADEQNSSSDNSGAAQMMVKFDELRLQAQKQREERLLLNGKQGGSDGYYCSGGGCDAPQKITCCSKNSSTKQNCKNSCGGTSDSCQSDPIEATTVVSSK